MRMIDADALMADIERTIENSGCVNHEGDIMDCVRYAPTISAVPVVRGEWNPIFKGADTCKCSVCKRDGVSDSDYGFIAMPYCPNCGAKMEDKPCG